MGEEDSGRKHLLPLLAIGAIASASGIALGLLIDWFPTAASEEAKPIDTLWDVLLIVSVPIFVLVQTIVLFSVWRFRMRPGEEELGRAADPRQHAARGGLDRRPGDHPRRPVLLRLGRP